MEISTLQIVATLASLFLTAPSSASPPSNAALQPFIQCFLKSSETSSDVLHTSTSTAYESILESQAHNMRLLASNANQKPSAIVTATTESHISETVKCAHKHGLQLRTRSGGHDYEGMSYVADNKEKPFVVVDLARFRRIDVDAENRTAWVQAGATVGELYYTVFNETNGTAGFPAGTCPTVGVGGHISVGGLGAMLRKHGASADKVIDTKIVGIDGRVMDRREMGEDLFWAIRGGGAASFGVVVAFKLQLVDVPPVVTAFSIYRNMSQNGPRLIARWQEVSPNMDENLFVRAILQSTAEADSTGKASIHVEFISLFLGTRNELLSEMGKSFPELGLEEEACIEMNWLESALFMYSMPGPPVEALLCRPTKHGNSFKSKSDFLTELVTEAQWEEIWGALSGIKRKGVGLWMIMEPLGGWMSNIPESEIAYPHRRGINVQYFSSWAGSELGWLDSMRELYSFMTPYVSSNPRLAYYGYKDIDLGSADYAKAREWGERYFKGNFERLATVKARVDPFNFFRNEQSIPPLNSDRIRTGICPTSSSSLEQWIKTRFMGHNDGIQCMSNSM